VSTDLTTKDLERVLGSVDEDIDRIRTLVAEIGKAYKGREGESVEPDRLAKLDEQAGQLEDHIKHVQDVQRPCPECAKELERIRNRLGDVRRRLHNWPETNSLRVANQLYLSELLAEVQEALKEIRLLRVPRVINERHLRHLRVGCNFDFLKEYKDDLGAEELGEDVRPQVLSDLRADPSIQGWVDEVTGVILKASRNPARRVLSYVLVFGLPVLGLAAFVLVLPLLEPTKGEWSRRAIGVNYLALMAGYVVHVIKKGLEGGRLAGLDELLMWLHVQEMKLIPIGLSVWVVFVVIGGLGLFPDVGLYKQITSTTLLTAFASGIAVDSIAAGALKQYQRKVSAEAVKLQSALAS